MDRIAKKKEDWIIHNLLECWGDSSELGRIGVDVNDGCEKIIQLLLSLNIPHWKVIESVEQYIQKREWVVSKQKKQTHLDTEAKKSATTQALYCHFVYTYL